MLTDTEERLEPEQRDRRPRIMRAPPDSDHDAQDHRPEGDQRGADRPADPELVHLLVGRLQGLVHLALRVERHETADDNHSGEDVGLGPVKGPDGGEAAERNGHPRVAELAAELHGGAGDHGDTGRRKALCCVDVL